MIQKPQRLVVNPEEESRDLGFGSVVSAESHERLLNRDGTFNVGRRGLGFWPALNPYYMLLTITWPKFIGLVALFFTATNLCFAIAYLLCGDGAIVSQPDVALGNEFLRAFFFSVDTLATIGYGNISPSGRAAHTVVAVEALVGILGTALITGMCFARFSRPTACIAFSNRAVIAPYRGATALMFRVANIRTNQIIELACKLLFARFEDEDGHSIRRFYSLRLEREKVVFFPLSWTVVHPIDESSPLFGLTADDLHRGNAEFLILLTGLDETFSQIVHTRTSYSHEEVAWNARFGSVFNERVGNEPLTIDIRRLHDIEPAEVSPEPAD